MIKIYKFVDSSAKTAYVIRFRHPFYLVLSDLLITGSLSNAVLRRYEIESAFYPIFKKLKMNEIYIIENYIRHYCTSLLLYKPIIVQA